MTPASNVLWVTSMISIPKSRLKFPSINITLDNHNLQGDPQDEGAGVLEPKLRATISQQLLQLDEVCHGSLCEGRLQTLRDSCPLSDTGWRVGMVTR